jgi:signal transduction histidine kinase/ActR/RegA family two-component response regulator
MSLRFRVMLPPIPTRIYVFAPDQVQSVQKIALVREEGGDDPVEVLAADAEISVLLERDHRTSGRQPIGMIVEDSGDALEAISLGADDAVVLHTVDEPSFVEFVDRVRLRASQRREHERLSQDVAHAEKLTALGTLVAGVGHELNNPLAAITMSLDLVRERVMKDRAIVKQLSRQLQEGSVVGPEHAAELQRLSTVRDHDGQLFDEISSATDLVAQLVRDLRVFSRSSGPETPTLIEPSSLIEQALRLVRREITAYGVIERDFGHDTRPIVGPRNRLTQVLTNLLVNAAHAIGEADRDLHRVRVTIRRDDHFIAISVSDTGLGVPEEALERIFDPFYTTKREGMGTGLGLSLSRATLRQLGGDLIVSSVYGEGATFICLIPLPTEEALRNASSWSVPLVRESVATGPLSVLLVDDDERVLRAGARVLQSKHRVLIAHDGQEAIDLLCSGSEADVIVMELDIPERDGVELYEWLKLNQPQLAEHVVVATAAGDRERYDEFLAHEKLHVLPKPFGTDALLRAVDAVAEPDRQSYVNPKSA